jgi:3'-phosphoadenosine 5'-phosphosulfate sulfotransferase (PAPS reductase)/FAD synthetase
MNKIIRPKGHDDSVFIVSMSGGKDSTALALAMREAEIPCRYVFADTQWEAPETYEYLATLERILGITIDRVRSTLGGMVDIARHKAGFPHRTGRWCTVELKVKPLRAYHDAIDDDTVSVVGIRAEESPARAAMSDFEYDERWGGYVWRPIMGWSITNVLAIHHRHDVPVNPLYQRGHDRVGCYPCINENKSGVALIARHSPDRIDEIDTTEREFTAERIRRNASGEGNFKHTQATFFMPKEAGVPAAIREVVAWSRTARGGVQLNLLQESPDSGCFRWGMCEPPTKDGE